MVNSSSKLFTAALAAIRFAASGMMLFLLACLFLFPVSSSAVEDGTPVQKELTISLMHAAAKGDAAAIARLVANGANLDARIDLESGEIGEMSDDMFVVMSSLSVSTLCGCPATTQTLLQSGATPSEVDLVTAILLGQVEVARAMLPYLRVDERSEPLIPLLVQRMPAEASRILRDMHVRQLIGPSTPPGLDEWALLAAAVEPAFATSAEDPIFGLLSELVKEGYDIEAEWSDGDTTWTARNFASQSGDVLLARALAAEGAALRSGMSDQREKELQLVGAARIGNIVGVELLLGEGVAPDAVGVDGRHALAQAISRGHFDVAKRILAAGGDPDLFAKEEASPLVSAATANQVELAAELLDKGALADRLDGNGDFALRVAARQGAVEMVELLLRRGATPQFRDAEGDTALHGLIDPNDQPLFAAPRDRPIHAVHLDVVRILGAAGFPFESANAQGETVLSSNFGISGDRELLIALLEAGARATDSDVGRAIKREDPALLRTLLLYSRGERLPFTTLQAAIAKIDEAPDLTLALLEHGIQIPPDDGDLRSLLVTIAGGSSEIALGLLLAQGLPLAVDPENKALEEALTQGRPKNVALLASEGLDLMRRDILGRTALHRVIINDARGDFPSKLLGPQQASISALIDAGYLISTPDDNGRTVFEYAASKPSTLTALNAAVGNAGASSEGIHAAVREDDLKRVRQLAADAESRESLDILGRTPLGLALQRQNWPAARILLRAGASIAVVSRAPWQPSDIDFANEPAVASAFAVRLLVRPLIEVPKDTRPATLLHARTAYSDGASPPIGNFVWELQCMAAATNCGGGLSVEGDEKVVYGLIQSTRSDTEGKSNFGLIQRNLRSIHLSEDIDLGSLAGPYNLDFGELTFFISGEVTIEPCNFTIEDPKCAPGIRLVNPNLPTGLSMLTDTGYEELPIANLRYVQENGQSGSLSPGEEIILDRSVGPIIVRMDEVRARVFALWVEIERLAAEEIRPLPLEPSTSNRMNLYARVLRLIQQYNDSPSSAAERAANKRIATTIAALSNEAYLAKYPAVVLELLRQQAQVVATLEPQVRDIQNAVLAQAAYTPEQIDLLLTQIDLALASSGAFETQILVEIRSELFAMREMAEASGVALNMLRDRLFTDADILIERYQALVLEYSQYVSSSELHLALTDDQRTAIRERISGPEVYITDAAADGNGQLLRRAFGLPDPVQ